MKIRFESDDKILSIPSMIIVVKSVFQKDSKFHPKVYLHEFKYKLESVLKFCSMNISVINISSAFIFNGTKKRIILKQIFMRHIMRSIKEINI